MAACDYCELADYAPCCADAGQEIWDKWAACEFESAIEYKKTIAGYHTLPPHKR